MKVSPPLQWMQAMFVLAQEGLLPILRSCAGGGHAYTNLRLAGVLPFMGLRSSAEHVHLVFLDDSKNGSGDPRTCAVTTLGTLEGATGSTPPLRQRNRCLQGRELVWGMGCSHSQAVRVNSTKPHMFKSNCLGHHT